MNHLTYTQIPSLPSPLPPAPTPALWVVRAELPALCSRAPSCLFHSRWWFVSQSPSSSHPPLPALCPQVHSLCPCFCSRPGTGFISTGFLDYTNVLMYNVWFSLFNLLHSVRQALGPSTSLKMTQICSFLWLSNIPLYICTTSSLSIHLSMDIWVVSMSWLL